MPQDDVEPAVDIDGPARLDRLIPRAAVVVRPAPRGARPTAYAPGAPGRERIRADSIPVLDPGAVAAELLLSRPRAEELLRDALAPDDETPSMVWVSGDSELAVHAARLRVGFARGTVVVGLPVECDQTGRVEMAVPFALGTPEAPAGLLMAAPARPDGPGPLVVAWGAVVVAALHRALLDVLAAVAATAGVDRDGRRLLPGAASCDGRVLAVVPQARHAVDRGRLG